jgi:hypothetical protein
MKRVSYAGETFLTADDTADALMHLTAALGRAQNAQVVELPTVDARGRHQIVVLVVGPASQLVATPEESIYEEPESSAIVAELEARTQAMRANYGQALASQGSISDYDLDELDQT